MSNTSLKQSRGLSRQAHLSSSAGEGAGVSGGAQGSLPRHVVLQPKGCGAVGSKILVGLPGLAKVLRALQHHGCWPGRLEDQDQVREVEGGLQVQPDGLLRGVPGRLPPRAGPAEGGVGHGSGGMRQPRVGPAAAAASGGLAVARGVLGIGAEGLGSVAPAGRLRLQRPPVGQVAHAGVAGLLARAAHPGCTAQAWKENEVTMGCVLGPCHTPRGCAALNHPPPQQLRPWCPSTHQ